jgi:cellulose synthase operon protein C
MRRRGTELNRIPFVWVAVLTALSLAATLVRADEPYLKFLAGLKDRGYYDTALEYLQSVENDSRTPRDVKIVIPYERAQILIDGGSSVVSFDEQRAQLDQAEANLDRFVKSSPDHPLVGQANSDRANLLKRRAQVDVWDADASSQPAQQRELQQRARRHLDQAKSIIAAAVAQHDKALKAFPTYIPETERTRRAERDEALARSMQAQLDAAEIDYWHARTFPLGSGERKKALEAAGTAFESVAQKYSQDVAGVYAVIWQGKCFEELGDAGKALGIYKRVLEHEDSQSVVQTLKDTALQFRLVCLNSDQKRDHSVVIEEAEAWLRNSPGRTTTPAGLGIQWELCRALETLGNDRTRSEAQRRADLNQALDRARIVSRYGGENKANATRLVQRLMVSMDKKGAAPRDFESAYAAGSAIVEEAGKTGEAYRAAIAKGDTKAAAELMRMIRSSGEDAARLFTTALSMRTPRTDPEKGATARLQLAYAYFLQGRYLECAAIADHQMRTYATESQDVSREAGFLAMSALDAALASAGRGPSVEADWMQSIGESMIAKWPESDRTQEARMLLGRSAWNQQRFLDAARWWTAVPPAASQFATAQISAGQAYWKRYIEAAQQPEADRPPLEELNRWKSSAIAALERGVSQRQVLLSGTAPTPDDLVLGKLVLAQIRNLDGQYKGLAGRDGAIELLTKSPHSVIAAVSVGEGESRPSDASKARSAKIASFAYQQLLRSYVGVRDLDAARDARQKLEQVAGSDNPAALTAIYVEFGRELQRELNQLRAIGQSDRATKTREAFEDFLNDLAARSDGQSLTSLLWIAETYAGLADDARNSSDSFATYVQKSAEVYNRILARADEPGFLPSPSYKTAIRLNLAVNQRRQKDFQAAEKTILELLRESPSAPDLQAEAATLYEEWGIAEGSAGQARLVTAVSGRRTAPEIWGWNGFVQRLQREPAARRTDAVNRLLLDARAHLASASLALAQSVQAPADKQRHLDRARHACLSFIRSTPGYSDEDYDRFNRLYAAVQRESRQPVTSLPRDSAQISAAVAELAKTTSSASGPASPVKMPAVATSAPHCWSLPSLVSDC